MENTRIEPIRPENIGTPVPLEYETMRGEIIGYINAILTLPQSTRDLAAGLWVEVYDRDNSDEWIVVSARAVEEYRQVGWIVEKTFTRPNIYKFRVPVNA